MEQREHHVAYSHTAAPVQQRYEPMEAGAAAAELRFDIIAPGRIVVTIVVQVGVLDELHPAKIGRRPPRPDRLHDSQARFEVGRVHVYHTSSMHVLGGTERTNEQTQKACGWVGCWSDDNMYSSGFPKELLSLPASSRANTRAANDMPFLYALPRNQGRGGAGGRRLFFWGLPWLLTAPPLRCCCCERDSKRPPSAFTSPNRKKLYSRVGRSLTISNTEGTSAAGVT